MPSPFPGMNPFLENSDSWEDFSCNFIVVARTLLTSKVGSNYYVKIGVHRSFHELSAEERRLFPKLAPVEVEKYRFLEIRDLLHRRVVTVIRLLSLSEKTPGPAREDYLVKRREVLAGHPHLVEIDLRRGGTRPYEFPPCDYYVLVSRYQNRPQVLIWPFGLRDPLPTIPIPLANPDPEVSLDLRAVLDRVYDAADYGKYIYADTPEPPLSAEDAAWAKPFLPR